MIFIIVVKFSPPQKNFKIQTILIKKFKTNKKKM